jgi:L-malate glycosyltransferase
MNLPAGQQAEADSHASTSATSPPAVPKVFFSPIFLLVNSLETGGTERQFSELAKALRSRNMPVHLACLLNKGGFSEQLGEIAEFDLGGSLYGLQSLRARWRLCRHLHQLGVKVAHAFDFYSNLTLIPAAKFAGVRVIGSHRQLGDLLTAAQLRAQLAMFMLCDRVVCNSRSAAERLVEAGLPRRKIAVISNGLSLAAFEDAAPALACVNGMVRIGMIARMNAEYKNHRSFLQAAKILSERFSNLEFIFAGDGPLRLGLEKEVADLGLHGRFQFLRDRRDISAVLHALDISVVPSLSESLSNVMLESMAAGVPVVATDVGGNPEIGGHGRALLVPASDTPALAAAIGKLIEDGALRKSMAREAQKFVRSMFSMDRICAEYESLYAEVLGQAKQSESLHVGDSKAASPSIRVAIVAPSLRYVGGQAVQADLLMRHWKNDDDVATSFIPIDPRFPFGFRWAERIPGLRTVLRAPLYFWQLWRRLSDADIVHIFSASYASFLLAPLPAWLVARKLGKKTLINYRSGEAHDHLQRSPIARDVLQRTDCLIVPSGYLVEVFREFGLNAQVVPNIVDLSQFQYRGRNPIRPHLICTRGFHAYYGIDVVMRAFASVQKEYPGAQLDLVGTGTLEHRIRSLVAALNLPNVRFLGAISRKEIGACYGAADIFVNASNLDNMPVSVLEAFAAGTPVATTAPEGMKYVVSHERTGLLSPPGDATALAQNILRILNDPELAARLAQNAFEESKRYRWTAVRTQWMNVYRDLVSTKK